MTNLDITLSTKVHLVKAMVFPVFIYGCESWIIKKAERRRIDAFWTAVLEKTLESPLDCKEIQPVHPTWDQSWVFIGGTDVEAETPNSLAAWCEELTHWKDPDAGKDWGQEKKGTTEDEMVEWHHWLSGHELGQTIGDDEEQGTLVQSMGSQRARHDLVT